MHYLLGQILYEQYWMALFNNTPYQRNYNQSKFYIKSTDVNRTIESVQSQMMGLFEKLDPLILPENMTQFSKPQWNSNNKDIVVNAGNFIFLKQELYSPLQKDIILFQFMLRNRVLNLSIMATFWGLILHRIVQTKIFGCPKTEMILDSRMLWIIKTLQKPLKLCPLKSEEKFLSGKQPDTMITMYLQAILVENIWKYLKILNIYVLWVRYFLHYRLHSYYWNVYESLLVPKTNKGHSNRIL